MLTAAHGKNGTAKSTKGSEVEAFEALFFNNLVVELEASFVHRTRSIELKDGNPLNEVRMLCNSILQDRGILAADKTIKYNPAKAVLKIQIGDTIKLTASDFVALYISFFAQLETKFMERK